MHSSGLFQCLPFLATSCCFQKIRLSSLNSALNSDKRSEIFVINLHFFKNFKIVCALKVKLYGIIRTRKFLKTLEIIGKKELTCQCTHVQNHVYANKSRHLYACDICQLSNPVIRSANDLLISFAKVLGILVGMLLGPEALLTFSVLISYSTSSGVVGFTKKVFFKGCLR